MTTSVQITNPDPNLNLKVSVAFCGNITLCPELFWVHLYFDGVVQDCSNSIANALELLQSCTKPSISYKFSIK